MREKTGNFHLLFYKTSSPMDVINLNDKLKFKTIGGNIHIKLFIGDNNPDTAIKLYH